MSGGTTTGLAGAAARERRDQSAHHAALFERVFERVYRYFRRMIGDRAEAEDCAQRALLELERSLREETYDPSRSFNTWIWMKAHKVFVAWCRERGRRLEALAGGPDRVAAADEPDPRASVDERLDAEVVLGALERRVGTEAYECFTLRYQAGLSLDEIAETVGRDRKTVTARLKAAHELIDRLLGVGSRRAAGP